MQLDFYSSNVSPAYPWITGVSGAIVLVCVFVWGLLRYLASGGRVASISERTRLVEWRERFFAIGFLAGILGGASGVFWIIEYGDARAADTKLQRILESDFRLSWSAPLRLVRFEGGPGPKSIELLGRSTNAGAQGLDLGLTEEDVERLRTYLAQKRPEFAARIAEVFSRGELPAATTITLY